MSCILKASPIKSTQHCELLPQPIRTWHALTSCSFVVHRARNGGEDPDTVALLHVVLRDVVPRRVRVGHTRQVDEDRPSGERFRVAPYADLADERPVGGLVLIFLFILVLVLLLVLLVPAFLVLGVDVLADLLSESPRVRRGDVLGRSKELRNFCIRDSESKMLANNYMHQGRQLTLVLRYNLVDRHPDELLLRDVGVHRVDLRPRNASVTAQIGAPLEVSVLVNEVIKQYSELISPLLFSQE